MATESRRDRRRIDAWSGITGTDVIPDGQFRWYDGVTGYGASEVLEVLGDGSTQLQNLDLRQVIIDGTQTIYGDKTFDDDITVNGSLSGTILPQVGSMYIQYPFEDIPATFYGGGTWVNISEKAKGYELSTSGWVSREDVGQTLYTETDYVVTDTISGSPSGTYDGETVSTVFTFTGQTIRFEGGNAETWEEGTQLDAMQRITASAGVALNRANLSSHTGAFSGTGANGLSDSSAISGGYDTFDFDSADSTSPNTAKTDDDETRMTNFTVRAWKRTA